MKILALDTSTSLGSAALLDDTQVLGEAAIGVRARHGETLLPALAHLLDTVGAGLDEIGLVGVGLGPGSFTGVRIALATAKGLAIAQGVPVVGVGSLQVLAAGLGPGTMAVPLFGAHKRQVYAAVYEVTTDGPVEHLAPMVGGPAEVAELVRAAVPDGAITLCGDGARLHGDALSAALGSRARVADPVHDTPRAAHLARLALARFEAGGPDDPDALEPSYVQESDAKPLP